MDAVQRNSGGLAQLDSSDSEHPKDKTEVKIHVALEVSLQTVL